MRCKSCGAHLQDSKCRYCGMEYNEESIPTLTEEKADAIWNPDTPTYTEFWKEEYARYNRSKNKIKRCCK